MGWFSDTLAQRGSASGSPSARTTPDVQTHGGASGSIADPMAYIQQRQQQLPATPESIEQIYQELKAAGVDVQRPTRAGGSKLSDDKLVLPGGAVYDFIGGVDGPNAQWTGPQAAGYWKDGQAYDDPGFQMRSSSSGGGMGLPPGYSMTGANSLASFGAPGLNAPWTQPFQAPTGTDDPGFQFAMDQGLEALDRNHAARGTILTGGATKDALKYATGMALQGYGDAWNRAKNVYDTDRGTFWQNQDNAFSRLGGAASMGAGASNSLANLYTQGANANAQATTTNTNNMNSLFGNLADFGMDAYSRWQNRNRNQPTA